jgi:hypothetical protein
MDKEKLTLLRSDVKAQMGVIETIYQSLEDRAAGLRPDDEVRLESVAYQLHNLYNAVEDLFHLVATHFENQIKDVSRWHTALLRRMRQGVEGVRPALLSDESYVLLNGLRGFRHFFRHAYAAPIEYTHIQLNLEKARRLRSRLLQDVEQFLQKLQP